MRWYAETPQRRVRQVLADAAIVVWVLLWWQVSRAVRSLVGALGTPGRGLASSADRLAGGFEDVADGVDGAPVVGGVLEAPFAALGRASTGIGDAGRAQEAAALALATWTGRVVLLVPVLLVGGVWLAVRWRAARRAGSATRLRDHGDLDALALRAITTRPARSLLRVTDTPGADWRAGEVEDLAALELAAIGLRPPGPTVSGGSDT